MEPLGIGMAVGEDALDQRIATGVNIADDAEVVAAEAARPADVQPGAHARRLRAAVHGGEALILPVLGRSEKDLTGGRVQRVTVEDSMSAVHA